MLCDVKVIFKRYNLAYIDTPLVFVVMIRLLGVDLSPIFNRVSIPNFLQTRIRFTPTQERKVFYFLFYEHRKKNCGTYTKVYVF